MLRMMYGGHYGELNDYETPPIARAGRQSPMERSGKASELSMDLNDLQDLRENMSRNLSELSLTSWQQEISNRSLDQTCLTDLTKVGAMPRYPSLDDVLEESDCADSSLRIPAGSLADIPEQLHEDSCTTFSNQQGSSAFQVLQDDWIDGDDDCNRDDCCHASNCSKKRVHFAGASSLEDVQEFEKPDADDYHLLYYMGQEIQKMIDDYKAEEKIERNVVR